MKHQLIATTAFFLLSSIALAEEVNVNKIETNEDTTISIRKGKNSDKSQAIYEVVENDEEITGDSAPLLKEARENWKKACADWKKETKENNKANSVLILNCGSMICVTEKMESTCKSSGKIKLKVKLSE